MTVGFRPVLRPRLVTFVVSRVNVRSLKKYPNQLERPFGTLLIGGSPRRERQKDTRGQVEEGEREAEKKKPETDAKRNFFL